MNLLIAGAAGAIGRAAARRLAPRMGIILANRDIHEVSGLAAEIKASGGQAHALEVDLANRKSMLEASVQIARNIGPVHALFHSIEAFSTRPVDEITSDNWELAMTTHVKSAYSCAQAVLPQMCERRQGVIVILVSDGAVTGLGGDVAYAAAQTALCSFTKSLAAEFASFGVRANALASGPIKALSLETAVSNQDLRDPQSRTSIRRFARPEEVASVLDFLISERSAYVTGQIIHVNGGDFMW